MMNLSKKFAAIAMTGLIAVTTFGAAPAYANGQDVGLIGGAIGGGFIGNLFGHGPGKVAATVGGAVLGGLIGNDIGRGVDRDNYYYRSSYHGGGYYSQPTTVYYSEPAPQRVYYVSPAYEERVRTYEVVPAPVYRETNYYYVR